MLFAFPEKWKKTNLTYHLKNYPRKNLDKPTALKEIQKAFAIWQEQVPLNFIRTENGPSDIEIEFVPTNNGDGPYKIVAIAYFPVSITVCALLNIGVC